MTDTGAATIAGAQGPIGRDAILALVPHQGAMCLWDAVDAWDGQRIVVRAGNHRDPGHPLRSHDRLRAVHLCEYGAQAMAVHGGLLARGGGMRARPGLLVALRGIELHVDRIDDLAGDLVGTADIVAASDHSWQYAFRIVHATRLLAEGRATVVLQA
jgi:predicted hotdog family 3-hydroxylacyl-ACP dehydratase